VFSDSVVKYGHGTLPFTLLEEQNLSA